ncbi:MAG: diguanylate cyclase [SAR324 cluster bacterium]|nr:diguanylate cyclase [SAR324 cluster bacterium]
MRKIFLDEYPDKIDQAIQLIQTTPYFRTVDKNLLREIFLKAWIFEVGTAEFLIREKNKSDRMVYILLEGEFDVFAGEKFILNIHQPGNTIGEMAVISPDTPRSADVTAVVPSKVIAIEASFLGKEDAGSQKLANAFFQMFSNILAEKLRITTERARLYENAVLEKQEIDKFNKDLTEVSQDLERELQDKLAQIKLFSQVVESNLDSIITADETGALLSGNQAFLSLFGYNNKEIKDIRLNSLFENLLEDQSTYTKVFADGWTGQKTATCKNKKTFPALISVSPIRSSVDHQTERTIFAVVIRDITIQKQYEEHILKVNEEQKQTFKELEKTLAALEKSNKIKDQFLSNMSSQLKTPLDSIANYTELIKKKIPDKNQSADYQSYFTHIMNEERKMDKLVGNLITMAEMTSSVDLTFNVILFSDFLSNLKDYVKEISNLSFDIDPTITAIVADKKKLFEALSDIFDYIKREKGVEIPLHCSFYQNTEKSLLELIITTGDPAVFKTDIEIAEAGPVADGVELSLQKGELLLPLAKRIIDLHQGEMQITTIEKNERISLRLPLDPNIELTARIKVLIIDEHEWDRKIIKGLIEKKFAYTEIFEFDSQISALNALNALKPDLIIVDPFFNEPEWEYDDLLKKLLSCNDDKTSTLVISDQLKNLNFRSAITKLGITDFLFKPFTVDDLLFKIKGIVENKQRLSLLSSNMQKAEKTAATDGMTGLFNRKHFDNFIKEEFIQAELNDNHCSVIMMDVDNFKHYNDTNGHQLGDEVLKKIARIMKEGVRKSDMAARYGGEEFVIVLPGTPKKMAENIAEKLRKTIAQEKFINEEKQPKGILSASFGVACYPENGDTPEIVLKGSDHCLYLAKERGRNMVVGAEGIVEL